MADFNTGRGKFQGLDSNVKYADSFVGATKVAETAKKGGSETKSDGYVVDAIDIDWGGLRLTTISDNWSFGLQTAESTEQNAGKGDNTKGIHSTAYLLNKISSSFTQIYNQIGGNDEAGLRQKIKKVEKAIEQISSSTPEQLNGIRDRIQTIEQELDNPGATSALVTILDTLDGFNKDTDNVKDYIDNHDKAILGASTDAATAYTVYGVRKYVDTTAKTNLIGKDGNLWPNQHTLYGVVKYSDNKNTDLENKLIGTSTDTTIDTHYGLKHILIGNTADTTINTHWGVKNSLIGTASDNKDSNTIKGAKKYADYVQNTLIGKSTDATTANTIWGAKNYAVKTLPGKSGDLWPTQHTIYGVAKYAETLSSSSYIAVEALEDRLIGASTDATTANTIWGAKNYAKEYTNQAIGTAESTLIGTASDNKDSNTIKGAKKYTDEAKKNLIGASTDASTADTIWGAKNYADDAAGNVLGQENDDWFSGKKTIYGAVNSLIGYYDDSQDSNSIWGAKNYADFKDSDLEKKLIGKSTDASTADTIWGAKNYANTTVKNSLVGATSDQWPTKQTIWGVKNSLIGTASDHSDFNTIWGAKNYAKNQISVTKYNQLTAQVMDENGEGVLKFLTVSSYLG